MTDEDRGPRASITIGRKVSDGNYGSYDLSVTVSDIYADTTADEIDAVLDAGRISYRQQIEELKSRFKNMQAEL